MAGIPERVIVAAQSATDEQFHRAEQAMAVAVGLLIEISVPEVRKASIKLAEDMLEEYGDLESVGNAGAFILMGAELLDSKSRSTSS